MTVSPYGKNGWRVNCYVGPALAGRLPHPLTGRERLTKTFAAKRDALAQEREWESLKADLRSGQHGGISILDWHKQYMDGVDRQTTFETYTYATKDFVATHGEVPISDWTTQRARADAATRPAGQIKVIRTMFAEAVEKGIIQTNPYRDIKTPRRDNRQTKASFHEVWPLDPQEQVKLLGHILDTATAIGGEARGADLRGKIAFAAWTGCRPGEIRGLHRADLDLTQGFAYITRVIDGTGAERQGTKTGLHRKVFVAEQAIADLRAMPVHLHQPYVFTNLGEPWKDTTFYGWWRRISDKADLGRMRFYDMRHFCATQLLEMGVESKDVAAQLGHSDTDLVDEVYGHPSHDRALDRIRHTMQAHTPAGTSQVRHIKFGESA